jgi:hypothetical protein
MSGINVGLYVSHDRDAGLGDRNVVFDPNASEVEVGCDLSLQSDMNECLVVVDVARGNA